MAYQEQTWADGEAGGTPISAERLTHIEAGIDLNQQQIDHKASKTHTHNAADVDSGMFTVERMPAMPINKVFELQDSLDAKASTEDLEAIELTPGPAGPKGDKGDAGDAGAAGPKGDTGAAGPAGADGAPSQADWDALVARVAALETPSA